MISLVAISLKENCQVISSEFHHFFWELSTCTNFWFMKFILPPIQFQNFWAVTVDRGSVFTLNNFHNWRDTSQMALWTLGFLSRSDLRVTAIFDFIRMVVFYIHLEQIFHNEMMLCSLLSNDFFHNVFESLKAFYMLHDHVMKSKAPNLYGTPRILGTNKDLLINPQAKKTSTL